MKTLVRSIYIAVAVLVLSAGPSFGVELNFKFKKGASVGYKANTSVVQTLSRQGLFVPMKSQYSLELISRQSITEVLADGTGYVESRVDSIAAKMSTNNKTYSYDSTTGKPADSMFEAIATLLEHPVYSNVTGKGKVLEKTGLNPIYDDILAKSPVKVKLHQNINVMAGEYVKAELFQLPGGDINPGATWQRQEALSDSLVSTTTLTVNYTYVGNETVSGYNCAKISFTFHIKPTYTPPQKYDDVETQVITETKGTGVFYVAIQEGILVKSSKILNIKTSDSLAFYSQGRPTTIFYTTNSDVNEVMMMTSYNPGQ